MNDQDVTLTPCWPGQKTDDEIVEEIIANFNVHAVHLAMVALAWTWLGAGVPSPADIKYEATRLVKQILSEDAQFIAVETGGLRVERYRADGEDGIKLSFVAAESKVVR